MHTRHSDTGYHSPIEGIRQKTLVYGEKALMTEFRLAASSVLPMHSHPYEQTGYLVSGRTRLHIGDTIHECRPGDSWNIPPDVPHGADIVEDSVAIEVFSPLRKDYLPREKSD